MADVRLDPPAVEALDERVGLGTGGQDAGGEHAHETTPSPEALGDQALALLRGRRVLEHGVDVRDVAAREPHGALLADRLREAEVGDRRGTGITRYGPQPGQATHRSMRRG